MVKMASLLKVDPEGLNKLTKSYKNIYPITAGFEDFAKTKFMNPRVKQAQQAIRIKLMISNAFENVKNDIQSSEKIFYSLGNY